LANAVSAAVIHTEKSAEANKTTPTWIASIFVGIERKMIEAASQIRGWSEATPCQYPHLETLL
jgi:hypothetical protein